MIQQMKIVTTWLLARVLLLVVIVSLLEQERMSATLVELLEEHISLPIQVDKSKVGLDLVVEMLLILVPLLTQKEVC